MDTLNLKVGGMTCSGCVNSVNKVLRALPGVADVQVTLASGAVTVSYDAAKAQTAQFKRAIEDAGYDVL